MKKINNWFLFYFYWLNKRFGWFDLISCKESIVPDKFNDVLHRFEDEFDVDWRPDVYFIVVEINVDWFVWSELFEFDDEHSDDKWLWKLLINYEFVLFFLNIFNSNLIIIVWFNFKYIINNEIEF